MRREAAFSLGRFWVEQRVSNCAHLYSVETTGELSTINNTTLTTTLPQNDERNSALIDLWRSTCCAMIAPGHPPTSPMKIRISSEIRRRPAIAADLSIAYAKKQAALTTKYHPATHAGTRQTKAVNTKTTRKSGIAKKVAVPQLAADLSRFRITALDGRIICTRLARFFPSEFNSTSNETGSPISGRPDGRSKDLM